jgi:hypothetical protein
MSRIVIVGLTTLPSSTSRLLRQCGILNIPQAYRPPRPVTGIGLLLLFTPWPAVYLEDSRSSWREQNPVSPQGSGSRSLFWECAPRSAWTALWQSTDLSPRQGTSMWERMKVGCKHTPYPWGEWWMSECVMDAPGSRSALLLTRILSVLTLQLRY